MRIWRTLAANPAFTLAAMAVLGTGIGANTTRFSIVGAVVLHPIPWPDANRLVMLQETRRGFVEPTHVSTANYVDWHAQNHVFAPLAGMRFVYINLSDSRAEPERVQGLRVTADF